MVLSDSQAIRNRKLLFIGQRSYQLLRERGMTPLGTGLYPRPTPLPTGLQGWLKMFARNTFLPGLDPRLCDEILNEVEDICRVDMYWNDGHPGMGEGDVKKGEEGWELMYVRLRGVARWDGDQ